VDAKTVSKSRLLPQQTSAAITQGGMRRLLPRLAGRTAHGCRRDGETPLISVR